MHPYERKFVCNASYIDIRSRRFVLICGYLEIWKCMPMLTKRVYMNVLCNSSRYEYHTIMVAKLMIQKLQKMISEKFVRLHQQNSHALFIFYWFLFVMPHACEPILLHCASPNSGIIFLRPWVMIYDVVCLGFDSSAVHIMPAVSLVRRGVWYLHTETAQSTGIFLVIIFSHDQQ